MKKPLVDDYKRRSEKYGEYVKTYRDSSLYDVMMRGLKPLPQGHLRALDVACGQGDSSRHLKDVGIEVYYFDITPEMINKGIERGLIPEEFAFIGDMEKTDFEDEFFDIVMSRYAFHDIQDKENHLHELRRVLKKRGKLQIVDMCSPSPENPEVKKFYNEYHKWKTSNQPRECWIPDVEEIYNLLNLSGFTNFNESWYTSKIKTNQWLEEPFVNTMSPKAL